MLMTKTTTKPYLTGGVG